MNNENLDNIYGSKIVKDGDDFILIIPDEVCEKLGFKVDDELSVDIYDEKIQISSKGALRETNTNIENDCTVSNSEGGWVSLITIFLISAFNLIFFYIGKYYS